MESPQAAQLFKTLGSATLLELSLILVVATLLIVAVQKLLPWLAEQLHGAHRL